MIELVGVSKHFRGVAALDNVDLTLGEGEVLGLIGSNGSGKTTLIGIASGILRPSAGKILLDGRNLSHKGATTFARLGVGRTFQQVRLFEDMTVKETVVVGALAKSAAVDRVSDLLRLCELEDLSARNAFALSYGQQRRVEIARALAGSPRYLMLDEPAAGMNEHETARLLETIRRVLRETGCAILIVDHDLHLLMELCDRIQVLDEGRTIAVGPPAKIRRDPAVVNAYIGPRRHD